MSMTQVIRIRSGNWTILLLAFTQNSSLPDRPPQLEPLRQSVGLFAAPELTATLQPQQTSATQSSAPNNLGILLPFQTVLLLPPKQTCYCCNLHQANRFGYLPSIALIIDHRVYWL
ncbi:hypothetical protein PGT21_036235 [Puccinia graminis f. sp. tritici]|uniref:Uncharacterized protein n=1 Tax=Puccinia graminis f. sp. tritici TaxID=56615 RepID=A0A5B0PH61_PUCGR|nr:hypothetical protein PGT21_036235 [Puccinia graminis f. sp. tritici]KAA1100363.1 hypothetical protein PGTUg99_023384 [Puccinia graminis f. sp. tritici]